MTNQEKRFQLLNGSIGWQLRQGIWLRQRHLAQTKVCQTQWMESAFVKGRQIQMDCIYFCLCDGNIDQNMDQFEVVRKLLPACERLSMALALYFNHENVLRVINFSHRRVIIFIHTCTYIGRFISFHSSSFKFSPSSSSVHSIQFMIPIMLIT